MRKNLVSSFLCILGLLGGREVLASTPQEPGEILIEPKTFKTRAGEVIEYEIGTIFVPENRSDPDSRLIGVGFARFPTTSKDSALPPVFRLPGGPGSSYLASLESKDRSRRERVIAELASFRHSCDVVLVNQRGFSEHGGDVLRATIRIPQRSAEEAITLADMVAMFEDFAANAVDKYLTTEVDLSGYTVVECAHDVDALRTALGYDKIILNGTSFGSQWSFAVMKLHPDIVERALLSGVEPLNCGFDMPSYVFAAVQRMWRAIEQDPRFEPFLPAGGMSEAARVVIERLERHPLRIEARGTGKVIGVLGPLDFPWDEPSQILELYHGITDRWQQQFASAGGGGERTMNLLGPLIDSSLGTTPERRHRLWTDPATRYLSRRNFAPYLASAGTWPSPDVGDEFRTPEVCEIPVVFAQGTWDTKTPLENTFEIAPFFINSRVIIAERGGHGVLNPIANQLPEVWKELVEFVITGDMEGIPARVRLEPSRRFTPPSFSPPKR